MSDAIDALNKIVNTCSQRKIDTDDDGFAVNLDLLTQVVECAGDALEDHVKAADRRRPRKERTYKEIVRRIALFFCDGCDTAETAYYTEEGVREILMSYDIETVDYRGRRVKIV